MTTITALVNVLGLASIAWIAWYFWFHRNEGVTAQVVAGRQEIDIRVKGGYSPDVIMVKAGKPVRLNITREESSLCSELIVFDGIDRSATLPEGETVPIDFTAGSPGEIPFQCQMGMIRGKIVVTP